jgi:hypothetical protein
MEVLDRFGAGALRSIGSLLWRTIGKAVIAAMQRLFGFGTA